MLARTFLSKSAAFRGLPARYVEGPILITKQLYQTSAPRRCLPHDMLWNNPGELTYTFVKSEPMVRIMYVTMASSALEVVAVTAHFTLPYAGHAPSELKNTLLPTVLVCSLVLSGVIMFFSKCIVHKMFYNPQTMRIVFETRSLLNKRQRAQAMLSDIKPRSSPLGNITIFGRPYYVDVEKVKSKPLFEKLLEVSL